MTDERSFVSEAPPARRLSKRELLMRLVMADLLERPGQGPLARRFSLPQSKEASREPSEKA